MAWNDAPPSAQELAQAKPDTSWASAPPTPQELGQQGGIPGFMQRHPTIAGYTQGALNQLPAAGAIGGAVLGGAAGTVAEPGGGTAAGGILGAGLGGAAGASAKDIGEAYLLGKQKSREEIYTDPVKGGLIGATGEAGAQGLSAAGSAISESPLAQKAAGLVGKGLAKVGSTVSGVPEQDIATYATQKPAVEALSKESSGSVPEAADSIRQKYLDDISQTKKSLNGTISSTLSENPATIEAKPILEAINKQKGQINAKLNPDQLAEVDSVLGKVNAVTDEQGQIPVKDAHDLKETLQELASGAYKKNGQLFMMGSKAANAARSGAAITRQSINEVAPEVAGANNQLAELHDIQDSINKNLISPGKPEAALLSAGSGENERNALNLQRIGDFTGTDTASPAQQLSAMRSFKNAGLLPAGAKTGYAVGRMGAGSLLGAGMGYESGGRTGAELGAIGGAAMSSPAAIKGMIDSGLLTKEALSSPLVQRSLTQGLLNKQP